MASRQDGPKDVPFCGVSGGGIEMSNLMGTVPAQTQHQQQGLALPPMLWPSNQHLGGPFMAPLQPSSPTRIGPQHHHRHVPANQQHHQQHLQQHHPHQQPTPQPQQFNEFLYNFQSYAGQPGQPETYSVLPVGHGNFLKVYHCSENPGNNDAALYQLHAAYQQQQQPQFIPHSPPSPPSHMNSTQQTPQLPVTSTAPPTTNATQSQFYELFASNSPMPKPDTLNPAPSQQAQLSEKELPSSNSNMFINQLVNNWSPTLTNDAYTQFGGVQSNEIQYQSIPTESNSIDTVSKQASPQVSVLPVQQKQQQQQQQHQQQQLKPHTPPNAEANTASNIININSAASAAIPEVKKRIVAEVKPMRMTYSDVLSKGTAKPTNSHRAQSSTQEANTVQTRRQPIDETNAQHDRTTKKSPTHEPKDNSYAQHIQQQQQQQQQPPQPLSSNIQVNGSGSATGINNGNGNSRNKKRSNNASGISMSSLPQQKSQQLQQQTKGKQNFTANSKKRGNNHNNNSNSNNNSNTNGNSNSNSSSKRNEQQGDNNSKQQQQQQSQPKDYNLYYNVAAKNYENATAKSSTSNNIHTGGGSASASSNSNNVRKTNKYTNSANSNVSNSSNSANTNNSSNVNSSSSKRYHNASNSNSFNSTYSYSSKRNRNSAYTSPSMLSSATSNRNYELIKRFLRAWWTYTLKILTWLFYLVYDIIVLGCSMVYDRLTHGYHTGLAYLKQLHKDFRQSSYKPSIWWRNYLRRFDARFKKNSRWAFWRRFYKKNQPEPASDSFKGGRLPQTGEEAMYSLLNCKGKDAYSILGVPPDSSQEQIRKHYKKIAVLVHPDKNKQAGAEEAFKVLQRAFELIGEPENRLAYDQSLAEALHAEKAWTELHDLLSQLQTKITEAANTIRCSTCGLRHPRKLTDRPHYAARECASCKIRHSAKEGDIWAETSMLGLRWKYLALMEGKVYDITEWANCQKGALSNLEPNSHIVQYRIVRGAQQQQQQQQQQPHHQPHSQYPHHERGNMGSGSSTGGGTNGKFKRDIPPSEASLHEFLDNLYSGQNPNQSNSTTYSGSSRRRTRRN